MIPFEDEASLTRSEEYVESVLEKNWDFVVRATSGVVDDIGERYPVVSENVSERIRGDVGEGFTSLFRPGVPDFLSFNEDGEYLFVEVKSSKDGLRHTQLKWLRDFKGVNCEIWFSEHQKDYDKFEASNIQSYSLRDQESASDTTIKPVNGCLMAEIPEELAAITGLEENSSVNWRLKSKDELILDTR